MAPERYVDHNELLAEAERVKVKLLGIQTETVQLVNEAQTNRLMTVREDLGYLPADPADPSGLVDTRVAQKTMVVPPIAVEEALPRTVESEKTNLLARKNITDILLGNDDKLIAIVGPCSIHDMDAALEYAKWLKGMREVYGNNLEIIMRFYTEKPRTELGWKGLVYDPLLDESNDINLGLIGTRMLAIQITTKGVPIAMERLNTSTPQYVDGLVAYDAIGARNTTDQKAREYASGTSSPIGLKNTVDGNIETAAEAVKSANAPHTFLGMDNSGLPMQVDTLGNETAHIILRGGAIGPNYYPENVSQTVDILRKKGLLEAIVIDASHGNSGKKAEKQSEVIKTASSQVALGQFAIKGVMIESNLVFGKQDITKVKKEDLIYGMSITDECVGLDQTEEMLRILSQSVDLRRAALSKV